MRMTFGKLVRRCVVDIRVGTRRVQRVMFRGPGEDEARQIWPDDEGAVTGVALDLAPVSGGEDGAYWRHALGVLFGAADYELPQDHAFITGQVDIGGQRFTFGTDETEGPGREREVAGYENGVVTLAGAQIPPDKLHVGSEVRVTVFIPEHYTREVRSMVGELDELLEVPWLPGSGLEGAVNARHSMNVYLKGAPSGETYISHYSRARIWGGGTDNFTAYPSDGFEVPAGDTDLRIVATGSIVSKARVKFPYFDREFVFRVVSVIRHG